MGISVHGSSGATVGFLKISGSDPRAETTKASLGVKDSKAFNTASQRFVALQAFCWHMFCRQLGAWGSAFPGLVEYECLEHTPKRRDSKRF